MKLPGVLENAISPLRKIYQMKITKKGLLYKNDIVRKNVIVIIISILLFIVLYSCAYIPWLNIGYDTIRIEELSINRSGFNITKTIQIPLNYGGMSDKKNDSICIFKHFKWTNYKYKKERRDIIDWKCIFRDINRINDENYMAKEKISVTSSYMYKSLKDNSKIKIDTFFHNVPLDGETQYEDASISTIRSNHIKNDDKQVWSIIDSYWSCRFPDVPKTSCATGEILLSTIIQVPITSKQNWFRYDNLSRRIINIEVSDIPDSLILDLCGPYRVVSADVLPDKTTMTKMIFVGNGNIKNYLGKTVGFYIEFPYKEPVQEARILAITTLLISVLITLMINCVITLFKILNRHKKIEKMILHAIPCYGAFSDCSECEMYRSCSYRAKIKLNNPIKQTKRLTKIYQKRQTR